MQLLITCSFAHSASTAPKRCAARAGRHLCKLWRRNAPPTVRFTVTRRARMVQRASSPLGDSSGPGSVQSGPHTRAPPSRKFCALVLFVISVEVLTCTSHAFWAPNDSKVAHILRVRTVTVFGAVKEGCFLLYGSFFSRLEFPWRKKTTCRCVKAV